MRFEIAEHQINYFNEFGFIEFEQIIPESVIETWAKSKAKGANLRKQDPAIDAILMRPLFAKMAASLVRQARIRLLFDQVFTKGAIPKVFETPRALQEISCFQDTLIGALFPISFGAADPLPPPFSNTLRNIVFLKLDYPIDWKPLFSPHRHVLLTFGSQRSVYILNETDPYTHEFKKYGYVFGDAPKQEDCPLFHFRPL